MSGFPHRRRFHRLRTRITVGLTFGTAVVVVLASALVWWSARSALLAGIDRGLARRSEEFTAHVWWQGGRLHPHIERFVPPEFQAGARGGGLFLGIAAVENGRELLRSPAFPRDAALQRLLVRGGPSGGTAHVGEGVHVRWRLVEFAPRPQPPPEPPHGPRPDGAPPPWFDEPPEPPGAAATAPPPRLRLLLGRDISPVATDLHHLGLALAGLCAAATLLAAGLSFWLRAQILKPVDRLGDALRAIDPTARAVRLDDTAVPSELAVLISRLNELFARVEQAFQREKRTIADIAHELRTPLAGLRATLEFSQLGSQSGAPPPTTRSALPPHTETDRGAAAAPAAATIERCLAITLGMQQVIEDLLAIARIESGHERVERSPCQPLALLDAAAAEAAPLLAQRGLALRWGERDAAMLASDARRLRLVFANLLGNAAQHAPAGGTVELALARVADGLRLTIANACAGLQAADAEQVFTPFWRGDQVRTGGTAHAGLGLALCQRLVRLLGGEIAARIADDRFAIAVTFPEGAASQPAP